MLLYLILLLLVTCTCFKGDNRPWPLPLIMTLFVGGVFGTIWYVDCSIRGLQRKYGLVCSECGAYLEPRVGKPNVADGKCAKCRAQVVDEAR